MDIRPAHSSVVLILSVIVGGLFLGCSRPPGSYTVRYLGADAWPYCGHAVLALPLGAFLTGGVAAFNYSVVVLAYLLPPLIALTYGLTWALDFSILYQLGMLALVIAAMEVGYLAGAILAELMSR